METPSRVATAAAAAGIAAMSLFAGAPVLIQIGAVGARAGWSIFMLGILFGLIATVLGALGLWLTRGGGETSGRERAAMGSMLGLAIVGVVAVAGAGAFGLPVINDITTDPNDPPAFVAALEVDDNRGRDMAYPAESFAPQQKAAYPDLASIRIDVSPDEAFIRSEAAVGELSWQIHRSDRAGGQLEVTKESSIFKFVDDIVIRIRPDGTGSIIDMRAKSRLGRGDLGANAAHIRAFRDIVLE